MLFGRTREVGGDFWDVPKPVVGAVGVCSVVVALPGREACLQSGRAWDVMLWISFISFVGIGLYLAVTKLGKIFG